MAVVPAAIVWVAIVVLFWERVTCSVGPGRRRRGGEHLHEPAVPGGIQHHLDAGYGGCEAEHADRRLLRPVTVVPRRELHPRLHLQEAGPRRSSGGEGDRATRGRDRVRSEEHTVVDQLDEGLRARWRRGRERHARGDPAGDVGDLIDLGRRGEQRDRRPGRADHRSDADAACDQPPARPGRSDQRQRPVRAGGEDGGGRARSAVGDHEIVANRSARRRGRGWRPGDLRGGAVVLNRGDGRRGERQGRAGDDWPHRERGLEAHPRRPRDGHNGLQIELRARWGRRQDQVPARALDATEAD